MSGYHTAYKLIAGDHMYSCPACGWEGTESELMEWGSDGEKCPRCENDLEMERPISGLATISEVKLAMADIASAEVGTGDPTIGDVLLNKPGEMVGGVEWRRVDDLFGRMPDFIGIWRAIGLREGEALDEDDLGTSWTWDSGAAKAYNRPEGAESVVVAHGEVAKDDVDWPATYALNILLPTEKEIRLEAGTDIELLDVDDKEVGRHVRASGSENFRNLDVDLRDALEHMGELAGTAINLDDFRVERHPTVAVRDLLAKWFDYSSWGEWREGELAEIRAEDGDMALHDELTSFRGPEWADRAIGWLTDGVPAIVLMETPDGYKDLADGRGRVSFVTGMGFKTISVAVVRPYSGTGIGGSKS